MSKETLVVSVSGGRTSAFMAAWIKENPGIVAEKLGVDEVEVIHIFANTGMEHDDTLRFLHDVDRNFGLGVVWVEGETQHGVRKGSKARVTNFEQAFRLHQWEDPKHPFNSFVQKYGVPNVKFLGCTREMKLNPINDYMRSLGYGPKDYVSAVGIREDEKRRVSSRVDKRIVYPLVDWEPTDKEDVLSYWRGFDWDLGIPEWLGNCVMCYKKSVKKLALASKRLPMAFDFSREMEKRHGWVGPEFQKDNPPDRPRVMFRGGRSTDELLSYIETLNMGGYAEKFIREDDTNTCSESCEMFPTEFFQTELFPTEFCRD